jgi:hypothetical protein
VASYKTKKERSILIKKKVYSTPKNDKINIKKKRELKYYLILQNINP